MLCRGAANKTGELCNKAFRRGVTRYMQRLFYMRFLAAAYRGKLRLSVPPTGASCDTICMTYIIV